MAQPRTALPAVGARPPHPAKAPSGRASPATQRKSEAPAASAQLSPGVIAFQTPSGFLDGARAGEAMPPPIQKKMESFFGADFSDVRVHVGDEAPRIGALAFTVGSDLYFAPGQYDPFSKKGQELLGHELTHVVQQREGRVQNPYGDGVAVVQDTALEDEADLMGKAVAEGRPRPVAQPKAARGPFDKGPVGSSPPDRGHNAQAKAGYRLILGAYMHDDAELPEPLAGHTFVALEGPDGERKAWGFSPANYSRYDPKKDLSRLRTGVEGRVHDDAAALSRPGVKTRAYAVSEAQAQAALQKVAEYQSGRHTFSLDRRQCSTFALDVLKAAKVEPPPGGEVRIPREVWRQLG